ncbi:Hypothetical predicted protein [Mytilus galloprovincialis]|uniref:dynamin GTPase n=1 Tax=Mytilus galloprovincialis TaxID=29158 RepID=A0A8B6EQJ5_MYTGA|nr:Hypothetical predicted protein [Mytilus galloprovincialis]
MYSDVLDELSGYDSTYNTQDYLPRVVVVGDQSSGKTSTLEMIAGARIFPRLQGSKYSSVRHHIYEYRNDVKEMTLVGMKDMYLCNISVLGSITRYRGKWIVYNGKHFLAFVPGVMEQPSLSHKWKNPLHTGDIVRETDPQGKHTIFVLTKADMVENNSVKPERVGWDTLHDEFQRIIEEDKKRKDHDEIFDQLKVAVVATSKAKHQWESKAEDSLLIMQKNTLDDKTIPDKEHWDMAVKFMEETLREKLQQTESKLKELTGPSTSEQWLSWQYKTEQHKQRDQAKAELDKILSREPVS